MHSQKLLTETDFDIGGRAEEAPWGAEPPAPSWQSEDTVRRATEQAICAFTRLTAPCVGTRSILNFLCHKNDLRCRSAVWQLCHPVHVHLPLTAIAPSGSHQHKHDVTKRPGGFAPMRLMPTSSTPHSSMGEETSVERLMVVWWQKHIYKLYQTSAKAIFQY